MSRMHEIMKERQEADEAFSIFKKARSNTIDRLNKEIEEYGPIKIGDIIDVNFGYSHEGKKMIVDEMFIYIEWDGKGVLARGRVLKNDGTPGLKKARHLASLKVTS